MENNQLFVGIDFETANSDRRSACSVGLVVFNAGEVVFEYESLIKPPKEHDEFVYFNSTIHKIKKADVDDALNWKQVYSLIEPYINGSLMVAHNASFDISVFKALNKYYDIKLPEIDYFCSVDLSRQVLPYLNNHKLNTVSEFLEIELDHHNAKSDAVASAMIVYKCMAITETEKVIDLLEKVDISTKKLKY